MSKKYILTAEFQDDMVEIQGQFDTMSEAEIFIIKKDNEDSWHWDGADLVLTEVESGKCWLYTDTWETV